ncbi:hypothetical protein F5Y15DRAFT_34250 [Xylariaceae sp. FL0016]|nr:hypothetical protein F5Y15DRAFT_34250 [Xylariaceae sp. FL0016]
MPTMSMSAPCPDPAPVPHDPIYVDNTYGVNSTDQLPFSLSPDSASSSQGQGACDTVAYDNADIFHQQDLRVLGISPNGHPEYFLPTPWLADQASKIHYGFEDFASNSSQTGVLVCADCPDKTFFGKRELDRHRNEVHDKIALFQCPEPTCPRHFTWFTREPNRDRHVMTHHGHDGKGKLKSIPKRRRTRKLLPLDIHTVVKPSSDSPATRSSSKPPTPASRSDDTVFSDQEVLFLRVRIGELMNDITQWKQRYDDATSRHEERVDRLLRMLECQPN